MKVALVAIGVALVLAIGCVRTDWIDRTLVTVDVSQLPHAAYPLAPGSQTACYFPWLKVSVALRYALTFPWATDAWRELRQHIP